MKEPAAKYMPVLRYDPPYAWVGEVLEDDVLKQTHEAVHRWDAMKFRVIGALFGGGLSVLWVLPLIGTFLPLMGLNGILVAMGIWVLLLLPVSAVVGSIFMARRFGTGFAIVRTGDDGIEPITMHTFPGRQMLTEVTITTGEGEEAHEETIPAIAFLPSAPDLLKVFKSSALKRFLTRTPKGAGATRLQLSAVIVGFVAMLVMMFFMYNVSKEQPVTPPAQEVQNAAQR